MVETDFINQIFDDLLFQLNSGNTIENIEKGQTKIDLEQVKEWKIKYGYKLNIYPNDHFIENEPHFHFDNKAKNISYKMSFTGKVFECKGKNNIDSKTMKALKYFLSKSNIRELLIEKWNKNNPNEIFTK